LMTTSLRGETLPAANDIVYWLSEFKKEPVLAFADPSLPLPKAIEDIFTEKFVLPPIQRGELHRLLRPEEARRISRGSFKIADQLRLYQYVSGLNVIRLRWLMQMVGRSTEPSAANGVDKMFQLIRKQTTANDMVPAVSATELAGYEDVKRILTQRVIHPIEWRNSSSNDKELAEADLLVPRGIILYGPPRNGKTEMAKWLATELQWPISIIRGPELRNKFLGETERAIRSIFTKARQSAPSVILIDELDAITGTRRDDENRADLSMVAMLLTEMDGLNTEESVLVIGTTNRLESVDPAFKAPGRFGLLVKVDYPNPHDRLKILKHYRACMHLLELTDNSLEKLVERTEGYMHSAEFESKERLRDALMKMYPAPVLSAAEAEIRSYLNHRLGINQIPKWSCDHLRGICQQMLVEIKNDSSKQINDEIFWEDILSAVRGSDDPSNRINSALVLENLAGRSWRGE
jgi:AAA+ superfamily predicted ATPase